MPNRFRILMLHGSTALIGFAIGCLANYFWLFNYDEPSLPPVSWCPSYEMGLENPAHLAIGAISLVVSLFSICFLVYTVHED